MAYSVRIRPEEVDSKLLLERAHTCPSDGLCRCAARDETGCGIQHGPGEVPEDVGLAVPVVDVLVDDQLAEQIQQAADLP